MSFVVTGLILPTPLIGRLSDRRPVHRHEVISGAYWSTEVVAETGLRPDTPSLAAEVTMFTNHDISRKL